MTKATNGILDILNTYKLTQTELAARFGIPLRTVQNWVAEGTNHRECPAYVVGMMAEILANTK